MISRFGDKYMPRRAKVGDCGYDLYMPYDVAMEPGKEEYINTGVCLEDGDIPTDCWIMVVPRSSMGFKYGFRFTNSVGVIDRGYRDTIKMNVTVDKPVYLKDGDRVAQMIVVPCRYIAGEIPPKEKRNGGIGSTGE